MAFGKHIIQILLIAALFLSLLLFVYAVFHSYQPASLTKKQSNGIKGFENAGTGSDIKRAPSTIGQNSSRSRHPVDNNSSQTLTQAFKDESHHQDDIQTAQELERDVRVLCWVMTSPDNHKSRAVHVLKTWGKRCTKLLFVSEGNDSDLPIMQVKVKHGREHLTAKTMKAFDHIYEHHMNDADWFMKADDDTYVILENLRYFLSSQNVDDPVFFGQHFHVLVHPQGYFSGGAAYVLSREALKRYGRRPRDACKEDGGAEDVAMGRCMQAVGVRAGDSRDSLNRSRFHCFTPADHLDGNYPEWYLKYTDGQSGANSISDYAISFHYISIQEMYHLEFFIYHLHPYGISTDKHLNRIPLPSPKTVKPRRYSVPTLVNKTVNSLLIKKILTQ